ARTGGAVVGMDDELHRPQAIDADLAGGVDGEAPELPEVLDECVRAGRDLVPALRKVARILEPLRVLERQELELREVLVDGPRVRAAVDDVVAGGEHDREDGIEPVDDPDAASVRDADRAGPAAGQHRLS